MGWPAVMQQCWRSFDSLSAQRQLTVVRQLQSMPHGMINPSVYFQRIIDQTFAASPAPSTAEPVRILRRGDPIPALKPEVWP